MRRWITTASIVAFLATGVAAAQTKVDSAAEARTAQSGGSMHMTSTTKHKGPGPNTKIKTETVIGSVKEYVSGKKIVVTGPKNKDYKFDLDDNVGMKGPVNVGERVSVTHSKGDSGDKQTTVVPYPMAATHTKKSKKSAA
jgi:hypothetical protein